MFSQIKDRKHIEQNFHSVAKVMPRGGTAECWGIKNFSVGICDGAPTTARSSFRFANIMKRIDFRAMYFLILYPSLYRLALWIERIAVNIEIVGSSLTTYNMRNFFSFFIINHAMHDFTRLTCKSICSRIHFKALY